MISVGTFVQRVDALGDNDPDTGQPDPDRVAAREVLTARGLTDAVLAEQRTILERIETIVDAPPAPTPAPEDITAAEDAMWGYYLEWSTIARMAITDLRMQRILGLRRGSGRKIEDEEVDVVAPEAEVPVVVY